MTTHKLRILFLLPDFPFPTSTGGRLKVFNILKYLSEFHRCDILSFGILDREVEATFRLELPNVNIIGLIPLSRGFVWRLSRVLKIFLLTPPSFSVYSSIDFKNALQKSLNETSYDVIHYDIVNMAQYLSIGKHVASVHAPNDATSLVYYDVAKDLKWGRKKVQTLLSAVILKRFERTKYPLFDKIHVVSVQDAKYLRNLSPEIDVEVIPICITEIVHLKVDTIFSENKPQKNCKIVCTGSFENHAIAEAIFDFVKIVWPRIIAENPTVVFIILGKNIPDHMMKLFDSAVNVKVLTWVDDYSQFLASSDIVLVPDRVGPHGAKTRAVEAMNLRLPVVGTLTGFAGLPFVDKQHGILYETMDECFEAMSTLIGDGSLRLAIGAEGHKMIVENFSADVIGPRYQKLYLDAFYKHKSYLSRVV